MSSDKYMGQLADNMGGETIDSSSISFGEE